MLHRYPQDSAVGQWELLCIILVFYGSVVNHWMYYRSVCLLASGAQNCNHSLTMPRIRNCPVNEQCFTHYQSTVGNDCLPCTSVITVRIMQYLACSFNHNILYCLFVFHQVPTDCYLLISYWMQQDMYRAGCYCILILTSLWNSFVAC